MAERFIRQLSCFRDRYVAAEAIRRAPDGYVCEVKPPTRTLEQNSLLWARLTELSARLPWDGERLTATEYKDLLTACLRKQKVVRGVEGGLVFLGARTSQMTIAEMGELLDLIDAFAAERGIVFKDPRADTPVPIGSSVGETPGASVSRTKGETGMHGPAQAHGALNHSDERNT